MSTHKFQTEVNELLHLIIHSLYSHKEIFLRELVSNASDAIHKLKFLSLTDERFKALELNPRIDLFLDRDKNMLVVSDNGIGMNETELEEHLGTIARSGTRSFLDNLKKDAASAVSANDLIGQFGVGFYSAFMVADKIGVLTRKAGEEKAWLWTSDGKGEYQIEPAERDGHGTSVRIILNDEGKEYLDRWSVESIVKKYSNHISFPIFVNFEEPDVDEKGKEKPGPKKLTTEQVNSGSALWKRPRTELKDDDYREFYKSVFNETEDPMLWSHTAAEGTLEYTTLFFVPSKAPIDLYHANFEPGVKLYVRRVFIMDDSRELLPTYLRFVRGVIDSEDLPLNVSREILQHNRVFTQIRTASVKKLLGEFQKVSEDADRYGIFWQEFGRPLKEGLAQDWENRDILLELVRYKSLASGKLTSLKDYASAMKPSQKEIFYITGRSDVNLAGSPLLEGYKSKGIDVLIMDDEIDELVIPMVRTYKEFPLKAVNRSDTTDKPDPAAVEAVQPLLARMKEVLKDEAKDVVPSGRLTDSPCCLVADKDDPTLHMQSLMRSMGREAPQPSRPVLEVNPSHPVIVKTAGLKDAERQDEVIRLLFEEALLLEGARLKDTAQFAKRLNSFLEKALT